MSKPSQNLENLGIKLPAGALPLGSYVPAVRTGNLVYISGQLPIKAGKLVYRGRAGEDIDLDTAARAAELCFINAMAALSTIGLNVDSVVRVVKLGGYVQCTRDFKQQPRVINGASDLSRRIFGDNGVHARAALGVNSLPMDAVVELEVVFEVRD
jgi:enamine deaminase RidA (YjgF/YER057c/UK114 family)